MSDFLQDLPTEKDHPITPVETGEAGVEASISAAFPHEEAVLEDTLTVGETEFSNFGASDFITTQEAVAFVQENIPPEHLDQLNSVEYVDDSLMREMGVLGVWSGDLKTGEAAIEIYPQESTDGMIHTLAHEIGHNAAFHLPTEAWDEWAGMYTISLLRLIFSGGALDEFVSPYAATSADEDFAECYAAYINDPELLQSVCPEKYEYMKNHLFNGQEY